jgi:MoaA/NifB/PqqE/SkfB family radical SAM enzyme
MNRARLAIKDIRHWTKRACLSLPFTVPPEQIQVDITDLCNYRCPTCSKWHQKSSEGELTTRQWKGFLTRVRTLPFAKRVVFAGGEPLLRSDIVELVHHVTNLHLNTVLVTNGALLNEGKLRALQNAGLAFLMVSLNALNPAIHDETRGVKGSFKHIMEVLNWYDSLKEAMKLGIATVIMESNLNDVLDLVDLVIERKLHGVIFQTYVDNRVHHPFRGKSQKFREPEWYTTDPYVITDYKKLDAVIDRLLLRQREGAPILNAPSLLKAMKVYYRNPTCYDHIPCTAGVTSFLVDAYGDVRLCFGLDPIGNILSQNPLTIWKSSHAETLRKQVAQCHRSCRLMNHIY